MITTTLPGRLAYMFGLVREKMATELAPAEQRRLIEQRPWLTQDIVEWLREVFPADADPDARWRPVVVALAELPALRRMN